MHYLFNLILGDPQESADGAYYKADTDKEVNYDVLSGVYSSPTPSFNVNCQTTVTTRPVPRGRTVKDPMRAEGCFSVLRSASPLRKLARANRLTPKL